MTLGRDDEAEAAYGRALALDPRRSITLVPLAAIARNHRRWAESKLWFDSAVAVGPAVPYAYAARGTHHILFGEFGAAAVDAQTALRLDSSYEVPAQSVLAHALAMVGDTAAARLHLARAVRAMRDPVYRSATDARFVAAAQLGLGERYAALDLISRVRPRAAWLWFYLGDTVFTPLRGDPRFERIVAEARPAGAPARRWR